MNNEGNGYARGIDLFWRDNKYSFKNIQAITADAGGTKKKRVTVLLAEPLWSKYIKIEKAPKEPLGYANLGLTYMRMDGELKQSEKWINSALNLVPKNPDIRFLLAKIYEMTNRRKKALNIILDVVGDHSNHVPSLFQLSLYLMNDENGKIQQSALKYLTKLTNSLSGNIAAEFYLIESLLNNNENEKAFDRLSHVQQILPMLSDQSKKLIYKIFEFLRDGNTADAYASTIMLHNLIKPK